MIKNSRPNRAASGVKKETPHMMALHDFDELAASQCLQVEHLTVPGFLRRIPHKWHMNEIDRFGSQVGRAAESLHLVFMTAVDRSLGVLRVFPLPLLQRVYTLMAPQFGWPAEMPQLTDGTGKSQRDELRRTEGAKKTLETAAEHALAPEVKAAFTTVIGYLETEAKRLRATEQPSATTTPPPPLRAL